MYLNYIGHLLREKGNQAADPSTAPELREAKSVLQRVVDKMNAAPQFSRSQPTLYRQLAELCMQILSLIHI